jgi:hypothetical protein
MNPLFALSLSPEQVAIVALGACTTILVVALAFKKDLWKIAQRRRLQKLSKLLTQYGMAHIGHAFDCLADGDLAGAVAEARYIHRQLEDPATAVVLLSKITQAQLPILLNDQGERTVILKKVAEWAATHQPELKAAGYALAAVAL